MPKPVFQFITAIINYLKRQSGSIICLEIILLLLSYANYNAQSRIDQIDNILKPVVKYDLFHGRVLVAVKGKIIYNKGFGYSNMEWKTPNDRDTKFRIASISKQFTGLIILQLASEGKISLQGKISDYLPTYRKDTGSKVTIHQLLTHTSGIPNGGHITQGFWSRSQHTIINYSIHDFFEKFCSGDFEFEPGSKYKYSSIGYIILGAIIEEICKKPYAEVFAERITGRLKLKNTVCDDNIAIVENRAGGYSRNDFGWQNSVYHYMPILDGAGTVLTTPEDLFIYEQALYTNKLLSKEYLEMFYNPPETLGNLHFNNTGNFYSYGWEISFQRFTSGNDSTRLISHGGGIRGGSGFISRQPDNNYTVILLSNTEIGSNVLRDLSLDIIRILNKQKPVFENHLPIRQVIGKEIIENGIDFALNKYRELKSGQPKLFDFGVSQLNSLGYALKNRSRISDAIRIFQLNTQVFPQNANVYDSLAEAYMDDGQIDSAIKNYEKSLELNSGNTNARNMLIKLKKTDNSN